MKNLQEIFINLNEMSKILIMMEILIISSSSFKYKSNLLYSASNNGSIKNAKIVVPLKYISNFFRSFEIPLINCKIHLELNWTKNCVMSNIDGATTFKITDTKLYVPIVTLSTKDNVELTKIN